MSEEAFIRGILAKPKDPIRRLAYADWLEENGQEEHATLTRQQVTHDGWLLAADQLTCAVPWEGITVRWDRGLVEQVIGDQDALFDRLPAFGAKLLAVRRVVFLDGVPIRQRAMSTVGLPAEVFAELKGGRKRGTDGVFVERTYPTGDRAYLELSRAVVRAALKRAGVSPGEYPKIWVERDPLAR